jgi:hypothetical protein
MYIRSKVVKGRTYYQLVEGKRERTPDGSVVRQRIVMALGTCSTLPEALKARKRLLAQLRKSEASIAELYPGETPRPKRVVEELRSLGYAIPRLEREIERLAAWIKSGSIGTTAKRGTKSPSVGTTGPGS